MELLLAVAALLVGFFLLARGADALVDGGATLARRMGVEPWIVGLTVVAWGTSVPEVVVSAGESWAGNPGRALGNVLGSNVANIGLVLGVTGLILPRVLTGRIGWIDASVLAGALGGLWFALHDGAVTRVEGGVLLFVFVLYTLSIFRRPRLGGDGSVDEHASKRPVLSVLLGSLAIMAGARAVMFGGETVAVALGLPDAVIGFLIYALGTSLPELAAGVSSARKGHAEIGLGNVVGSNLFNTLAVVGIASLVRPLGPDGEAWSDVDLPNALAIDMPANVGFTLALFALPFLGKNRIKPTVLVIAWVTYMAMIGTR